MLTRKLDEVLKNLQTTVEQITSDQQKFDATPLNERSRQEAEIAKKLSDVDTRLNKMSADIRGLPTNSRDYFEGEYNDLRSQYNQLVWEFQEKKGANAPGMSKQEFLAKRKQAAAISSDLDEALYMGRDVLTTQNATKETLNMDRHLLENINRNLDHINGQADEGQKRGKRMIRRMLFSACLAWTIVVILALIDGALAYLYVAKKIGLPPFSK